MHSACVRTAQHTFAWHMAAVTLVLSLQIHFIFGAGGVIAQRVIAQTSVFSIWKWNLNFCSLVDDADVCISKKTNITIFQPVTFITVILCY